MKKILSLTLLLLFLLAICFSSKSGQVGLIWDASPDTNVVGYAIYHGFSSGNYLVRENVGNRLSVILTNLMTGTNYYFVATAYTIEGIESLPSNEVNGIAKTNTIVYPPTNLRLINN